MGRTSIPGASKAQTVAAHLAEHTGENSKYKLWVHSHKVVGNDIWGIYARVTPEAGLSYELCVTALEKYGSDWYWGNTWSIGSGPFALTCPEKMLRQWVALNDSLGKHLSCKEIGWIKSWFKAKKQREAIYKIAPGQIVYLPSMVMSMDGFCAHLPSKVRFHSVKGKWAIVAAKNGLFRVEPERVFTKIEQIKCTPGAEKPHTGQGSNLIGLD